MSSLITVSSPLGYVIGMAAALGTGWLFARSSSCRVVIEVCERRFDTLDGLRGFLASAVVLHHMAIYRNYYISGLWTAPESRFYNLLGPVPVILFFMVTGFLFWDKAISAGGKIEAWKLYRARIRRIAPLYFVLVLMVLAFTIGESGPHLNVSPRALAGELLNAMSMGFRMMPNINGTRVGGLAGSPTWTLHYEWTFYAILPLVAGLAVRRTRSVWLLVGPLVLLPTDRSYVIFLFGIACAYLVRMPRLTLAMRSRAAAVASLGSLLLIWLTPFRALSLGTYVLCFPPFLAIVCGNDFWGALKLPMCRHLGKISYSVYLLHCSLLYGLYRLPGIGHKLTGLSPVWFWLAMAGVMVIVVASSTITYTYIERPFMHRGSVAQASQAMVPPIADASVSAP